MTKQTKQAATEETYTEVLDRAWGDMPADPILPDGSWRLSLVSGTRKAADGDHSEQIILFLKAKDPLSDVDPEALDALGSNFDYGSAKLSYTIWIETPSDYRKVGKIMELAGIADKVPNMNSLKNIRGAGGVVIGQLKQRSYPDKRTGEVVTVSDVKQLAKDE